MNQIVVTVLHRVLPHAIIRVAFHARDRAKVRLNPLPVKLAHLHAPQNVVHHVLLHAKVQLQEITLIMTIGHHLQMVPKMVMDMSIWVFP